jgi:hypothetical protein
MKRARCAKLTAAAGEGYEHAAVQVFRWLLIDRRRARGKLECRRSRGCVSIVSPEPAKSLCCCERHSQAAGALSMPNLCLGTRTSSTARATSGGRCCIHERGELSGAALRAGHFCHCRIAAHTRSASTRTETSFVLRHTPPRLANTALMLESEHSLPGGSVEITYTVKHDA